MLSISFFILALAVSLTHAAPQPEYEHVNIANVSVPLSSAPLNKTLAYYRLNGTNGASNQLTHSFVTVSCGANMSVHHTDPDVFPNGGTPETPILILNHGYPESSYIWRRVTPEICKRVPCIVPDRAGYGLSTPCKNGTDEFTNAGAILEATQAIYGSNISVILGGHDRGARAMQRAAVSIDNWPFVNAIGVFLADIVPIVEEYRSFSNPNYSMGYFHWSFLPRGEFATDVIMAYGGGNWVDYINNAGSGINKTSIELFRADNAFETYHTFFDQLSVTNTSVFDYKDGNSVDYLAMVADQEAGRKIKLPTHVLYSYYNLVKESGFDVQKIWSEYVDPSAGLTTEPVCCGLGHFIIELAPQQTIDQLHTFLDRLGVTKQSL